MRRLLLLCAAAAAAFAFAAPAYAGCGSSAYEYAGVQTRHAVHGVSAAITALSVPEVKDGHVAGWVGVASKNGQAWIQIGLSASPGYRTNEAYVEVAPPNRDPRYIIVRSAVPVGERHRFAVLEVAHRPGWWRAWLDGSPVSRPVLLTGSDGRWNAQVTAESYNDNSGACNLYAYSFGGVVLASAPGGIWRQLDAVSTFQDPGYRLVRRSRSEFVASSLAAPRTNA